jgi:hypothetical protein
MRGGGERNARRPVGESEKSEGQECAERSTIGEPVEAI